MGPPSCSNTALVDRVFGIVLSEQLICAHCGRASHVAEPHVEYFHIVQATALRNMAIAGVWVAAGWVGGAGGWYGCGKTLNSKP